jgi:inner membrane protein
MPSGRTHIVVATALTAGVCYTQQYPIHFILCGALGGLWPDTDTKKSIMGRLFPLWLICKHRGFTHSLLGLFIFTFVIAGIECNIETVVCFAVGYFSHLILDWTTPMGIPWRWPKRKMYSLRRF